RIGLQVSTRELALTNVDAARERTRIVLDAVVGDLDVVTPAMYEDGTTTLRAVGDRQTIDARRVAHEVAGERIPGVAAVIARSRVEGSVRVEMSRNVLEQRSGRGEATRLRTVRPGVGPVEVEALGQHRDASAFQSTHERGLLQQFGEVAVEA